MNVTAVVSRQSKRLSITHSLKSRSRRAGSDVGGGAFGGFAGIGEVFAKRVTSRPIARKMFTSLTKRLETASSLTFSLRDGGDPLT